MSGCYGGFKSKLFRLGWIRTRRSEHRYLRKKKIFSILPYHLLNNIRVCSLQCLCTWWRLNMALQKDRSVVRILTHLALQWLTKYTIGFTFPRECWKVMLTSLGMIQGPRPTPFAVTEFNPEKQTRPTTWNSRCWSQLLCTSSSNYLECY